MSENTREKQSVISRAREIIDNYQGKEIRIMEVCGTHTHEIFRLGLRQILPPSIRLISGPGCPVCVTPVSFIDEAVLLAVDHNATICTFGDLVRVPGSGMIPMEDGAGAQDGKPAFRKIPGSLAAQAEPASRSFMPRRTPLPMPGSTLMSRSFFYRSVLRRPHRHPVWQCRRRRRKESTISPF